MAVSLTEQPGRTATTDPPSATTKWALEGITDFGTATSYLMANIPEYFDHALGILYRQDMNITEIGQSLYHVTVPYGIIKRVNAGAYSISFDTTGGTVRVFHSKQTISKNAISGETAPDYKQLMGVTSDGVDGTDVIIPALKLNVTFKHPAGVITPAQMKAIHNITGTVNSAAFLGFAIGEVLFLGGTGNAGTDSETTVSYQFAVSPNKSSLSIGDIASFAKKGWEYVWIVYKDATSTAGGTDYPVKQPRFAYVERVYDTVDFRSVLGFG